VPSSWSKTHVLSEYNTQKSWVFYSFSLHRQGRIEGKCAEVRTFPPPPPPPFEISDLRLSNTTGILP